MTSLLIVSHDRIAKRMAGVAIRYYEVSRALAEQGLQVTLAAPKDSDPPHPLPKGLRFATFASFEDHALGALLNEHACLLAYPDTVWACRRWIDDLGTFTIVDGYDITLFEMLELQAALRSSVSDWIKGYQERLLYVLQRGDLFLAATERQRDFWLGLLTAAGRVDMEAYLSDPSLRSLVDLLPYGVPSEPPVHKRRVIRGVLPGISESDFVVLWGGGAWQWLDPVTLIRAAAVVVQHRQDIKFYFPGVHHPDSSLVGSMPVQQQLIALSEQLGLKDKFVFFGNWVEYDDWQNYLLESDCGVSLHYDHLEARFATRTRVMSYLWADLHMILTEGDELAERMAKLGIAKLVPPMDVHRVAEAILELADTVAGRRKPLDLTSVKLQFSWQMVTRSLAQRCLAVESSTSRNISRLHSSVNLSTHSRSDESESDTRQQMDSLPVALRLPLPSTAIAKGMYPFIRATVLWYIESLVSQQNALNTHLLTCLNQQQARLEQHEVRLADHQARLEQHEVRLADHQARLEQHEVRLADHQARLEQHEVRLADHQARLEQHEARLVEQQSRLVQCIEPRLTESELLMTDLVEQITAALLAEDD